MSDMKFLKYEAVQGEKHLGIATVKVDMPMILRFKIVPNKDGNGFFPAAASYKMGDKYVHAFLIDSNYDKEELEEMVKTEVRKSINSPTTSQSSENINSNVKNPLPAFSQASYVPPEPQKMDLPLDDLPF